MSESPGGLVRHLWLAPSSEHPIGWARGGTGDAASLTSSQGKLMLLEGGPCFEILSSELLSPLSHLARHAFLICCHPAACPLSTTSKI